MGRAAWSVVLVLAVVACGGDVEPGTHGPDRRARPRGGEPGQNDGAERGEQAPAPPEAPAPPQAPGAPGALEADRSAEPEPLPPLGERYPLYGVCFHFLAHVFAEPSGDAPVVGYMRRGAQFRAKPAVDGPGCEAGWYEVAGGGFVCRGRGYILGDSPRQFEPSPAPPALDDALPYSYGWVTRDDVPQYWRIPTVDEETRAAEAIDAMRSLRAAPGTADGGVPDAGPSTGFDPGTPEASDEPEKPGAMGDGGADDPLPDYVRMPMERGFYVSMDEEQEDGDRRFTRTVRGAFVPSDALHPAEAPSTRGVVLGGRWQLPLGIVWRSGVRRLQRDPESGRLRRADPIAQHTAFVVAEELQHDGRTYVVADEGFAVDSRAVRIARAQPRPRRVGEDAQWIHVDLSEQTLVAYEGDQPSFATVVSTGKKGYETPTGTWRIEAKHVSTTMDDLVAPDGAYLIEDVPWTMFFHRSYALHGAFWHGAFGRRRSHGCINLAPADARWLFWWTGPLLPPAWHGVLDARSPRKGSWVHITE